MKKAGAGKRGIGLWMLVALVTGNMMGSGVLLLPATLASIGSIGLVGWVCTSIGSLFLALVFSRLSRLVPKAGGPYAFTREALGEFPGFQVAYYYWVAIWVGNAGIAVAGVGYLSAFIPALLDNHWLRFGVSAGAIWLLTLINLMGFRFASQVQLIIFVCKVVPIGVLALVGLFYVNTDYLAAFNVSGESNFSAITHAVTLTLWSFIGLESASVPSDLVDDPDRNIPLATVGGVLLAAVIYIVSTLAVMGSMPMSVLAQSAAPFAAAMGLIIGPWTYWFMAGLGVIACFGTLNGWIMLQPQISKVMAKDKLFPLIFAKESKRGISTFGLVFPSVLVTALLWMSVNDSLVKQFNTIILLGVFAQLTPYLFSSLCELLLIIKLKIKISRLAMVKRIIVGFLAFLFTCWAVLGAGQEIVFYGSLLLFSSIPVYLIFKWSNADEG